MDLSVFGDGAGAVVLRRMSGSEYGLRSFSAGSDGDLGDYVTSGGGSSASGVPEEEAHYWRVQFSKVIPWALDRYELGIRQSVERAGLTLDDVDWVVPHQASARIVHEVADRLGMPRQKFVITFERTGNTVSGSVAIALDEAKHQGKFADGDWLVMPAVGAGMAWNAVTCQWHAPNGSRHVMSGPRCETEDRTALEGRSVCGSRGGQSGRHHRKQWRSGARGGCGVRQSGIRPRAPLLPQRRGRRSPRLRGGPRGQGDHIPGRPGPAGRLRPAHRPCQDGVRRGRCPCEQLGHRR